MRAVFVALLLIAPAAWAAVDPGARGSPPGRPVGWYTGLIVNQIVRPMAEAFEMKYPGIRVQYLAVRATPRPR